MAKAKKKKSKKSKKEKSLENKVRKEYVIIGVIVAIAIVLSIIYLVVTNESPEEIVEEQTEEREEYIYTYNGYEFWKDDNGFWNTKMEKHGGVKYIATFYYGPRELENISIEYKNNTFAKQLKHDERVYITFDPEDEDLAYIGVAASSLSSALKKVYFAEAVASCTKPIDVCAERPTITCDNTDNLVILVDSAPELSIVYEDNCLLIQGTGQDIIRAANKVLLGWYGITE